MKRILIVEDDFTNRMILQKFLSRYFKTHVAVDGNEAVSAVKMMYDEKTPYEIIFLDIMMPSKDGYEVLNEVRAMENELGIKIEKRIKIFMMTALDDAKNVMKAFREECDYYFTKPFDLAKLLQKLKDDDLLN